MQHFSEPLKSGPYGAIWREMVTEYPEFKSDPVPGN